MRSHGSRPSSRPSSEPSGLRVLQLIGDTDAEREHLHALELHRKLADEGLQLRTLALGVGRRAELADEVPSIAPARRSLAARRAVASEARWADVVVLHGARALTPASTPSPGASPPVVVSLAPSALQRSWHRWSSAATTTARAARVVVESSEAVLELEARTGRSLEHVDVVVPGSPDEARRWAGLLRDVVAVGS